MAALGKDKIKGAVFRSNLPKMTDETSDMEDSNSERESTISVSSEESPPPTQATVKNEPEMLRVQVVDWRKILQVTLQVI